MKRLLAAGSGSIFQICHAFRDGESGRLHNREFSLLEWYRVGYDYQQLMDEMELLLTTLSPRHCSFSRITYRQLFRQAIDIDIEVTPLPEMQAVCASKVPGTDVAELSFDQCLDLLLGVVIAPTMQGYQFVYDYPSSQGSLARANAHDDSVAERFELYFEGVELANGFSELTDASQQRARFLGDNLARQQAGLPQHALDENLLAALASGLDDCAGVALGLDRLLMVLLELDSIDQVLTFRE
jgi:lysyl-tRNA synthetase class 2